MAKKKPELENFRFEEEATEKINTILNKCIFAKIYIYI